jgi:hypothetical protein
MTQPAVDHPEMQEDPDASGFNGSMTTDSEDGQKGAAEKADRPGSVTERLQAAGDADDATRLGVLEDLDTQLEGDLDEEGPPRH